jgi:hypothetical protein
MSSNIRLDRVCEECNKIFVAKTTVTRFCSSRCNNKNYKEFPLGGANDIKKIANNVIKYALSLTGKTLNEDSTQDTEEENYSEHPLWNDLTNTYDGPIGVRTVIYRIIELSKEGKYSEDDILDIGIKAIELMQKESHNGVYYGGGSEPMGY